MTPLTDSAGREAPSTLPLPMAPLSPPAQTSLWEAMHAAGTLSTAQYVWRLWALLNGRR